MSRLFWIEIDGPGRLAIMARPRAGDWLDGEVDAWKTSGIDMVVSLLEPQEVLELELQREADLCGARGIDFVSFPIPDRGVPDRDGATQMARAGRTSARAACDRDPLPRRHRPVVDHGRLRADHVRDRG
jgi:hypothetical protein